MSVTIILYAEQAARLDFCIESIQRHTGPPYELIVIDELDDPAEAERYAENPGVRLMGWPGKLSAAEGFGIAASVAEFDTLVFMHDHIAVTGGWLSDLIECLNADRTLALIAPVMNDGKGEQLLDCEYSGIDSLFALARGRRAVRSRGIRKVDELAGALFMTRREVLGEIGGFDFERGGIEISRLCERARDAGYGIAVAKDCVVVNLLPFESGKGPVPEASSEKPDRLPTVTLCMIVKNEERTLARCLSSVSDVVDEIVIVDTGSTDRTKDIAREFTDRIYDFEWTNDFAAARNHAFSLATTDYIMWLDADDVLLAEDAARLKATLNDLSAGIDAISMPYHLAFDEDGRLLSSLRRNRIVKRERGFRWIGQVHEYLEVRGEILEAEAAVTHRRVHTDTNRNLLIYEERERAGERFSSRDLFYYGNELSDHKLWERAIEQYERFLTRDDGWQEDQIAACGRSADAYHALGKLKDARRKALQAFQYDSPRPEISCRLGFYHMEEGDYAGAIPWYEQALRIPSFVKTNAMVQHGSRTWVPHLQLCVCYDRLQMYDLARKHNEEAAEYVPNHPSVLQNRAYFNRLVEGRLQEARI